jgi:hypothetical protein
LLKRKGSREEKIIDPGCVSCFQLTSSKSETLEAFAKNAILERDSSPNLEVTSFLARKYEVEIIREEQASTFAVCAIYFKVVQSSAN